jgi:hypothetical protein
LGHLRRLANLAERVAMGGFARHLRMVAYKT